jgi:hypothetical protein
VRANAQRICIMVLHRATQQPSGSHVSHAQKLGSGFDVRTLLPRLPYAIVKSKAPPTPINCRWSYDSNIRKSGSPNIQLGVEPSLSPSQKDKYSPAIAVRRSRSARLTENIAKTNAEGGGRK